MHCTNCGHEIEGMEKFCPQCGAPLEIAVGGKKGGSSPWLKIVGIAGAAVLIIVIVALLVGGIGGTSSPEQTVRTLYKEFERLNASGVVDLFFLEEEYEQYREMMTENLQTMWSMIDSVSISNLTITVTSQTHDAAEVTAEYNVTYKLTDGSVGSEEDEANQFDLKRAGDRWLITDTDLWS